ncbi:MAG: hypothetical protein Q7W45_01715 [Bacteroidota bacterium]|nr:hypothetical protein [Bacteroidota bacterium]
MPNVSWHCMTVKLHDKDISNWVDYVQTKFADKSLFEITKGEYDFKIKSRTNKTTIWFDINVYEDNLTLNDYQYYNEDCKGWSGETKAANSAWGVFNQKNVDKLNDALQTPIKNGWISVDYYLGNRLYKSKTYYDKDKNSRPFVNVDSNFGCLSIILFPIFWLISKLMDMGIVGYKKEIIIDGINNAH